MTDRARELLERALEELIEQDLDLRSEFYTGGEWEGPKAIEEIRAYLAETEVKRKPINNDRIIDGYYESKGGAWLMQPFRSFTAGVRFAEKHHGIGGRDE